MEIPKGLHRRFVTKSCHVKLRCMPVDSQGNIDSSEGRHRKQEDSNTLYPECPRDQEIHNYNSKKSYFDFMQMTEWYQLPEQIQDGLGKKQNWCWCPPNIPGIDASKLMDVNLGFFVNVRFRQLAGVSENG